MSTFGRSRVLESRQAEIPCFGLSQRKNPDFVGRSDLFDLIDEQLLPLHRAEEEREGVHFFSLCGMGGIGKTDLAIEYAHSRRSEFAAIFWLEAGGVSQLASTFGQIPLLLGLETSKQARDLDSSIELAKAWLAESPDTDTVAQCPWLLIFDNADNLDIIVDYLPYEGNGSVLVTSRDPFAKEDLFENATGADLDPLSGEESIQLLSKLVPTRQGQADQDEQAASKSLAHHFDGLPLAVVQVAGFIRRRQLSIRDFVDLYTTDAAYGDFREISTPRQSRRYKHTLATTFALDGFNEESNKLVRLLAFMNPDRIREDIFIRAADSQPRSMWTAQQYEKARYDLLTASIIKRNVQLRELWIHRVIQAEIRTRLDKTQLYQDFNDSVALLADIWPAGDHSKQLVARWALCQDLLPHIENFFRLYQQYAKDWSGFAIEARFPKLLREAALYLHERCFSMEGKQYVRLALSLCEQAGITEEPLLSDIHMTLGALSNETNDPQTCLEQNILCLEIRKRVSGQNGKPDLRLAYAYSQMGIAYMMVKKRVQAKEYFKQSVQLLNLIQAPGDEYGFPSCNLGLAYWFHDELDLADECLTNLKYQREELHGKLDKVSYKTGRVLQALGNVRSSKAENCHAAGDEAGAQRLWDEAFQIHQDCLAQYESTLGKSSHRAADACHKLAEHHIRRKEDDQAQAYLDRALNIWGERSWFRNESSRTSFLRGKHLLSMQGDENHEKGTHWINRAKALRKEILPDEEPRDLDTRDFDDLVAFFSV